MMNSENPKIREEGKNSWLETAKKYGPYFEAIKDNLPKKFMKEFDKNAWFHDFVFERINVLNTGKRASIVEFEISQDQVAYKIVFSGVKGIKLDVPSTQCWLFGKLTWGYNEFELNDDGTWIIRILCDLECEVEVLFKKISISKL